MLPLETGYDSLLAGKGQDAAKLPALLSTASRTKNYLVHSVHSTKTEGPCSRYIKQGLGLKGKVETNNANTGGRIIAPREEKQGHGDFRVRLSTPSSARDPYWEK